jgi:hypothetical protein
MVNKMTENSEQVPVEQVPEKPKKSFVKEGDAPPVGKGPSEQKIVPCEVSLMLIYNQAKEHTALLTEVRDLLKSGITQTKPVEKASTVPIPVVKPEPAPVQTPAPAPVAQAPVASVNMTPRLQEIMTALEPIKELVYLDEEGSANDNLFFIIRPRQFLGSENFAKVANVMRSLGAQYQSAGKNSHFKASKAGK